MAEEMKAKIDGVDGLVEAYGLMAKLGISTEGLTDLDDAKRRMRQKLREQQGGRMPLPDKDMVSTLIRKDQQRKEKMLVLYSKVMTFTAEMNKHMKDDLEKAFPNLDHKLAAGERSLKHEKCAILIAGETSAGKSTLLNLLLGQTKQNLLPVAHLSVTSVICELKYGERPHAVAHRWPEKGKTGKPIEIPLSDESAGETLAKYIRPEGERGGRFPYKKIEIFWPSEWLRAGVTIVDSPGVGENEEMTNIVMEYMPKAFGFIYVLNCTNAGGIQPDRLQDLLLRSSTVSRERNVTGEEGEGWQLDPRSAIFVANKWEQVPVAERDDVKQMIYSKLGDIWSGLSESQVFFLSAKQASESMAEGAMDEDYARLLNGIETLLPIGLNQRLAKHFSYVFSVMEKALHIVRTYATQVDVKDAARSKKCYDLTRKLAGIENRPRNIQKEMDKQVDQEIKKAIAKAREHLSKPEVTEYICRWNETECPDSTKMQELEALIEAYAWKRIRHEINLWDKENKVFEDIHIRLMTAFGKKFRSLEGELEKIERLMTSWSTVTVPEGENDDFEDDNTGWSRTEKLLGGVSAPIWIPLGLVVALLALPAYGIREVFKTRDEKKKLREYRDNKAAEMNRRTKIILVNIQGSEQLGPLLKKQTARTLALVSEMVSRIPDIIKADKQMIRNIERQGGGVDEMKETLFTLEVKAFTLLGKMSMMYMLEIMSYDIAENDLHGWKPTDQPVASGAFAKVFKASLLSGGTSRQCALKIMADNQGLCSLMEHNAYAAQKEESNLRKLQHPHVVRYFGTSLTGDNHLLMVMEFCPCSLESYIKNRESYWPPGQCHGANQAKLHQSLIRATDLGYQIADGILGIHARGFVHRDLKPANILMSQKHQIRLADLGLTKSQQFITGTVAGSLLYMAPEVNTSGRVSYGQPADMYSFGLILWELWYGRIVPEVFQQKRMTVASPNEHETRPCAEGVWAKTMRECWSEKQDDRPDARACRDRLQAEKEHLAIVVAK